ncbi:hypothetical protein [Paenibacillus sp. FSL K6-2859]
MFKNTELIFGYPKVGFLSCALGYSIAISASNAGDELKRIGTGWYATKLK